MGVLKVGVIGAGHMGKIHGKLLQNSNMFDFLGFYDPQVSNLSAEHTFFNSLNELIDQVEALSICTSTSAHFELAQFAILGGKHVFIEKPVTQTALEAQKLVELIGKNNTIGAVGHVERFNPAFSAALPFISKPQRIEAVRYATQGSRGLDVSVVLDMMIHDIDLILALIQSPVVSVQARGHRSFTQSCDTAEVQLEFANGATALMLASRAHVRKYRSLTVYEHNKTIDLDLLNHSLTIQSWTPPLQDSLSPLIQPNNAILDELEDWGTAILNGSSPKVDLQAGLKNVELAEKIMQSLIYAVE